MSDTPTASLTYPTVPLDGGHVCDIIRAGDGGIYLGSGDGSDFSRFVDFGVKDAFCYRDNDQRDQGSFHSQWDEYLHRKMLYIPLVCSDMNIDANRK